MTQAETKDTSANSREPHDSAGPSQGGGNLTIWAMLGVLVLLGVGLAVISILKGGGINLESQISGLLPQSAGQVPDFTLTERSGRTVDLESLKGRIWIADFVFTRCSGPCLVMSTNMATVQKTLIATPGLFPKPKLVSFTVDPDWDTPETLGNYADKYGADPERWLFLTGAWDDIQSLARDGFHLGIEPADGETAQPIIHSKSFILVDAQGAIRGYYDGTDIQEVLRLITDVGRLNRER